MKMRKLFTLTLVFLLAFSLLAGCGANSASDGAVMENGLGAVTDAKDTELSTSESTGSTTALPQNQKLIRKFNIDAETEDLDALLSSVNSRISELGGYVEAQNVQNGSAYAGRRYRYASLTIRIPADQLDSFVTHVSDSANIVSSRETVDDVTLSYVATESRITALQTEQTRLLELLAKAESMEDILKIESRLTEVRTQLEEVTSQLRVYDNLVSYGTVTLNIDEVKEYTVVEEPETVWDRIRTGFTQNLEALGDGLTELFIFIVVSLPFLIPLVIIGGVLALLVILHSRKKKAKKAPPTDRDQAN